MSPTRARYVTVAFCVVLALITYIDRVAISQAAPFITKDLGLTRIEVGLDAHTPIEKSAESYDQVRRVRQVQGTS